MVLIFLCLEGSKVKEKSFAKLIRQNREISKISKKNWSFLWNSILLDYFLILHKKILEQCRKNYLECLPLHNWSFLSFPWPVFLKLKMLKIWKGLLVLPLLRCFIKSCHLWNSSCEIYTICVLSPFHYICQLKDSLFFLLSWN